MTQLTNVQRFMAIANQLPKRGEFNTRQTALQVGLVLEEVSELLTSLYRGREVGRGLAYALHSAAEQFKAGMYDDMIADGNRVEMLDAFADIRFVSEGGMAAMGADVAGAIDAVDMNNLTKFVECSECCGGGCGECNGNGRIAVRDENGKVVKPVGYEKVKLEQFL